MENPKASGNQVWELIYDENGEFLLKNTGTNKYLSSFSGPVVMTQKIDTSLSSYQKWKKSGCRIENVKTKKCLAYKSFLNADVCSLNVTYEDWDLIYQDF